MIKITGKFWLLALCLSLIFNVAFADEPDAGSSKITGFYATPKTVETDITNNSGTEDNNGGLGNNGGTDGNNGGTDGNSGGTDGSNGGTNGNNGGTVENDQINAIDQPANDELEKKKDTQDDVPREVVKEEGGFFHTVLNILPGLIVVGCLILIWINIGSLKKRLLAAEEKLEEIVPSESEGSSELNNNLSTVVAELRKLEARMSALEKDVQTIQGNFEKILKSIKKPAGTHMETSHPKIPQYSSYREEIPPSDNYSKTTTGTTPRPLSPLNKDIIQSSSEISKITEAFNKMMLDSTRQEGIDLWELRNGFIMAYHVVAFKCVNFQERMNHQSEVKPQFEKCQPSESTLWGIKLSDGTIAVLPGLREYEMTAHLYGGLKELFYSNYQGGSYRKIEVEQPAIMKSDFSLVKEGKLRLSQY